MELPKPYKKFLTELKAARKARGLSQGALAEAIKLSRAQFTAIENGRSIVNYAHLYNLSLALKVKFTIGDTQYPLASRFAE